MNKPGDRTIPTELRILILEDEPNDAELEITAIEEAGYVCHWDRVDTHKDFLSHLDASKYDIILSDFKLPDFDGLTALGIVLDRAVDIPFIIVSGTLGEEAAIEGLKAGATDYVLKDRLSRLVPVVQRALFEHAEHKRSQQIEEDRTRLLAAVEQVAEIIVVTDLDGIIQYANPAFTQITGYTNEEVLGQNPRILKSGKQDEAFYAQMWQMISSGQTWKGTLVNRRKDGTLYTEEVTISPVRDVAGKIINYVAVKHDITERKRIEEELLRTKEAAEAANRAKSLFLANMSHELRTPLNPIMGFADLLLEDKNLTEEQRESLGYINRRSRDLLQLLTDILDIAKIEANHMVLRPQEVDIRGVITEVISMFEQRSSANDVRLTTKLDIHLNAPLIIDPARLRQILLNLIGNAVAFTDQGEIIVSAYLEDATPDQSLTAGDHMLHLSVSDTGCGIAPEQQSLIFTSFQQADTSSTREHDGAGLGLAICKRLAELMKGTISVESALGEGSCFHVRLCVRVPDQEAHTMVTNDDAKANTPPYHPVRILLAEDDVDSIYLVQHILKNSEYSLTTVRNGQKAVDACAEQPFDMILMDVKMPVMDGLCATRMIREREQAQGKHTPIIATTAYAFDDDQAACIAAGMDDWITKPITRSVLTRMIAKYSDQILSH